MTVEVATAGAAGDAQYASVCVHSFERALIPGRSRKCIVCVISRQFRLISFIRLRPLSPTASRALTSRFYQKVKADPLLSPVFESFTAEHAKHVAIWLGEVFGGPPRYSGEHGGHRTVLERHRNLNLRQQQKDRWVELMLETAREVLPNDAELQARFADYIRWGAGIAVTASQPGFEIQHVGPVPNWGWTPQTGE